MSDEEKMRTLKEIQEDIEEVKETIIKLRNNVSTPESERKKMIAELDGYLEKLKKEEREKHAAKEYKKMNKSNWNSNLYLWRPEKRVKNRIRIMPKPEGSEAMWWMRVNIHVVEATYQRQQFVCNKQLFDLSCKLCNMKKRFKRQGKLEEAKEIRLRRYSFLNIIDREREAEGVKLWMAPISAWGRIYNHYSNDYHPVRFFDTPPNQELGQDQWDYGCDLNVFFNPDEEPLNMYKTEVPMAEFPRRESSPLGTEEQREKWTSEVLPLKPENFFDLVDKVKIQYVESSILSMVKEQREYKKREPLHNMTRFTDFTLAEKRKTKRILMALDDWTFERILEEEKKEFEVFLNKHPLYDGRTSFYWFELIRNVNEAEKNSLIEQNKQEREEMIKEYSDEKRSELELILANTEVVYNEWLEQYKVRYKAKYGEKDWTKS